MSSVQVEQMALPVEPTDKMLLDLALSIAWSDDIPGESREDYALGYQRMLERLPRGQPGFVLAPAEPGEDLLLAIAGLDRFVSDEEDGVCIELEMTYEGYKLMLFNMKSQ